MNEISWTVEVAVKPGRLEAFKQLAAEMVEGTSAEPETQIYEFFLSEDGTWGHIYERYASSEATLRHFAGFGEKWAERFMDCVEITKFTVYGNPTPELAEALGSIGGVVLGPLGGFAR